MSRIILRTRHCLQVRFLLVFPPIHNSEFFFFFHVVLFSELTLIVVPPMLDECLGFLKTKAPSLKYEVIVVSDGSKDGTARVAKEYVTKHGADVIRLLELESNRGKGGAIRLVRSIASSSYLLFVP